MPVSKQILTEEDTNLIKTVTLLPILLDNLAHAITELTKYEHRIIYSHIVYYLRDVESVIYRTLSELGRKMRMRGIKVLKTEITESNIKVDFLARGYTHQFSIFKELVRAELKTTLMNFRERI